MNKELIKVVERTKLIQPCKHLINAHGQCQWCHAYQLAIDADQMSRYITELLEAKTK